MNYYHVKITSDKVNQEVAAQIFSEIAQGREVRAFRFCEGYVYYCSCGLTDITSTLKAAEIADNEIEVLDEFEMIYDERYSTEKEN